MFRASEEQPIFQSSIRKSWVHVKELPCTHLLVPIPICFKWNRIIVKSFESTLSLLYPPSLSLCVSTPALWEREKERERRESAWERDLRKNCAQSKPHLNLSFGKSQKYTQFLWLMVDKSRCLALTYKKLIYPPIFSVVNCIVRWHCPCCHHKAKVSVWEWDPRVWGGIHYFCRCL